MKTSLLLAFLSLFFAAAMVADARLVGGEIDEEDGGNGSNRRRNLGFFGSSKTPEEKNEVLACLYSRCCLDGPEYGDCRCPVRNVHWIQYKWDDKCEEMGDYLDEQGVTPGC